MFNLPMRKGLIGLLVLLQYYEIGYKSSWATLLCTLTASPSIATWGPGSSLWSHELWAEW